MKKPKNDRLFEIISLEIIDLDILKLNKNKRFICIQNAKIKY